MFLFLFSLALIAFMLFFYGIGIRYLGIIPVFLFLIIIGYSSVKRPSLEISSGGLMRYSLFAAWGLVLFAVLGLLGFFGIGFPFSFLWLIVGSFVFWIGAHLFDYADGKKVFQFGYYLVLFVFLVVCSTKLIWIDFFDLLFSVSILHLGLISFLVFIVGTWFEVERNVWYTFFVSLLCVLFFSVIKLVPHFAGALALDSIFLTGIYAALRWFVQQKPVVREHVSVRRILAGERVTSHVVFSHKLLHQIFDFVNEMPLLFRYVLEFLNIFIVIALIVYFLGHWSVLDNVSQFLYWLIISFFVGNTLLLKRLGYTSIVQNFFLFLVIHLGMYISFFSYFGGDISSIVLWAVIWNLVTSVFLFYAPQILDRFFGVVDYWYWIIASIVSFGINVVLLLTTPFPGELIFFLVLLYVGIEGMLLFYGVKHVLKLSDQE